MAKNYGNRYTEQQLAILERKLRMVYSESKADLDGAVDRYYNGYTEVVNGKLIHHPGMYDRLRTELEAYERGEYTQEEFTKWWWSQEGRGKHIEAMRDEMARAMTETNMRAAALINDNTPGIYAMNANWTAYTIAVPRQDKDGNWTKEVTDGVAFNLVNEQTVRELVHDKNNHVEFRVNSVNRKADYEWNKDHITKALLAGILQGESVYKIADRFMQVQKRNTAAAIRNARTSFTSAQNAGSLNAMEQAVKMGINIKKQWMATRDERTRDRHLELNGEQQPVDKKFSNGLLYPGDAEGKPEETYNCRCTMVTVDPAVLGVDSDPYDVKGFNEWVKKNRTDLAKKQSNVVDNNQKKEDNSTKISNESDVLKPIIKADTVDQSVQEDNEENRHDHNSAGYSERIVTDGTVDKLLESAKEVLGIEFEEPEKFNPKIISMVTGELSKIYDIFGNIHESGFLKYISIHPNKNVEWYMGYYLPFSTIFFKKGMTSAKAVSLLAKDAKQQYDMGFWSTCAKEHGLRHEAGHAIQYMLLNNGSDPSVLSKRNEISEIRKAIIEKCGIVEWSMKDSKDNMKKAGEYISYYALKSDDEIISESIAEFMEGNPRETAKKVVEILLR